MREGRQYWRAGAVPSHRQVPSAPPPSSAHGDFRGWTPVAVTSDTRPPVVRWCWTSGVDFTDPFFGETVERCLYNPFRRFLWRETTVNELAVWADASPGLEPAGLVFHASRCGSTLVAQMFARLASTLVLSEPEPLDQVLRAGQGRAIEEDVVKRLRWTVSAMAQPRQRAQEQLIIKLDAWAVLWWRLLRRAFPRTPCVFLYREPAEVVASHLTRRGHHMVPGSLPRERLFGDAPDLGPLPPEVHCASVLAALFNAALEAALTGEMSLCHYRELPGLVPGRLAPLFGVGPGPDRARIFAEVAARDAKNPWSPYPAGAEAPRSIAPAVEQAVEGSAGPVYDRLERLRTHRLEDSGAP
jgi:hypothetical protein